jgi:tetratricopeptide (TPR) repeat protein
MTIRHLLTTSTFILAFAGAAGAQAPEPPPAPAPPAPVVAPAAPRPPRPLRLNGRFPIDVDAIYEQARDAIENAQFDLAIQDLDRVLADSAKERADAALYWKAYSQNRIGESKEALKALNELTKEFSKSTWAKDAKALALEIQQAAGQPVSAELQNDEELKLLALRGIMQSDPEKAVPIIEKMLDGNASPRVRDRALFVLAQSRAPKAHDIVIKTARNNANPDLQRSAIRYLGMMGGDDREALIGIYRSATDAAVKRQIINALFSQRNAKALVDLARAEKDPALKRDIVQKLSVMRAPEATDYMLELLK